MEATPMIEAFKIAVNKSTNRSQMYADVGKAFIEMSHTKNLFKRIEITNNNHPTFPSCFIKYNSLFAEITPDIFEELNQMVRKKEKEIDHKEEKERKENEEKEILDFLANNKE